MKRIGIVTDSHSSITPNEAQQLGVYVLPMPFYIGDECYYENKNLTRQEFFEKLDSGMKISTSQPSPANVTELWDIALAECGQILYIPISSGLSGSCETAFTLSSHAPYKGRVFVVDNGRVSTPLYRSILDALEMIEEGYSAEEIQKALYDARARMVIYVGVQTLKHLKEGGRISPATAALGTILNIKPVLKFDVGTLDTFQKCRGFTKAKHAMIKAMKHDLETTFQEEYKNGEVYLLTASSASPEETASWEAEVAAAFPDLKVMGSNLSLGVSCHIGAGGLGIGCSCRPKRPARCC